MSKYFQIYFILFFFAFSLPCKGQNQSVPIEKILKQLAIDSSEYDPYFVESKAVETNYGPNCIVRNLIEDKNGHIWLASWQGIIRYDGACFTNFTNKQNLRRYRVFCLLEDRKGNLWFGTIGAGIYVYDGQSFTNYTTKEGLVNDKSGCFYEDIAGQIWIGTMGGISRYDGKAKDTKSITFKNYTTEDGLSDSDVNSIIEDKNGHFWIGTRGKACVFDGQSFKEFYKENLSPFINVRCIVKDKNNNIWLGGNDGLWRYDEETQTQFNTNFVGYIYEDKAANIWTNSASDNAHFWELSRYDKRPLPYELPIVTPIRLEADMYFGIMEDRSGNIWWGSLKGIHRFDGTSFNDFKQ